MVKVIMLGTVWKNIHDIYIFINTKSTIEGVSQNAGHGDVLGCSIDLALGTTTSTRTVG
jgi:hypothetical protein